MSNLERFQFLKDNQAVIPKIYNYFFISNKKIKIETSLKPNELPKSIYVSLYPSFLKTEIVSNDNYVLKTIIHKGQNGAGVLLHEIDNIDAYLKELNQKRLLRQVNRDFKRLEAAFKVKYEFNFGDITNDKCDFLLKTLNQMIVNRFKTKKETHLFLEDWSFKTKNFFDLINKKKASLFVIYANEKPISIALNWHEGNSILFSETHSYDTSFNEYGLGHLNFYILLDWSIKNKIDFLDLGRGIYYHKKKWSNSFYNFEYRLYYNKKSIAAKTSIYFEIIKIKAKNAIRSFILIFNKNFDK